MMKIENITDDQLTECIGGSTDLDMLRRLLEKSINETTGILNPHLFADYFATAIEGFIQYDEDLENDEWQEAWDVNYSWGLDIAASIEELNNEITLATMQKDNYQ